MSPEKDIGTLLSIISSVSQVMIYPLALLAGWFHLRVSMLEKKDCSKIYIPRQEFEALWKTNAESLKRIEYGVGRVHKRIDDHFKEG